MKNILIILIFSNIVFASTFQMDIGISGGPTMDFSYNERVTINNDYDGFRFNSGFILNVHLALGRNDEIQNRILTSVSSMFETGYNFYNRRRSGRSIFDDDFEEDYSTYNYHNIILGYLFQFNFYNGISFGIGSGIFVPLYISANREDHSLGFSKYSYMTEFNQKDIASMYKIPFMPYIKLSLFRYMPLSNNKWAYKYGLSLLYNFGGELDVDNLVGLAFDRYLKYNFSALNIEIYFGFSFGKTK